MIDQNSDYIRRLAEASERIAGALEGFLELARKEDRFSEICDPQDHETVEDLYACSVCGPVEKAHAERETVKEAIDREFAESLASTVPDVRERAFGGRPALQKR